MGQSLMKISPGNDVSTMKKIVDIIEKRYAKHFVEASDDQKSSLAYFYRAVCETVEEINNSTFGYSQFKVPSADNLERSFNVHHKQSEEGVTRKEFEVIMREILLSEARFPGLGAKDTLIYIFGIPLAALAVKRGLFPRLLPNELFVPAVTSATVFTLAKLHKI